MYFNRLHSKIQKIVAKKMLMDTLIIHYQQNSLKPFYEILKKLTCLNMRKFIHLQRILAS